MQHFGGSVPTDNPHRGASMGTEWSWSSLLLSAGHDVRAGASAGGRVPCPVHGSDAGLGLDVREGLSGEADMWAEEGRSWRS